MREGDWTRRDYTGAMVGHVYKDKAWNDDYTNINCVNRQTNVREGDWTRRDYTEAMVGHVYIDKARNDD